MAHSSLIQVRVDDALKQSAESLFNDLGMDTPTAVRMFLKQAVMRRGLPFSVKMTDDFYNEHNMKVLQESIHQLEQGNTVVKTMDDLELLNTHE